MSGTVTVEAPANIAFVKYWGAEDLERAIPVNPSISMTLRHCVSRTSARLLGPAMPDEVSIAGDSGLVPAEGSFRDRVVAHLQRLREWAGRDEGVRIVTRNSFPASAGMASSASGFAALTVAVTRVFGRDPGVAELSELARRSGSGSASRSVLGGFVEWPAGPDPARCAAAQLASHEHWDLRDVVAIVQTGPKSVSSLQGHVRAPSSPHFDRRLQLVPHRLEIVRQAIADRDLERLGPVLEEDAIELHLVAMSSRPPIFYWQPATLRVLERVRELRVDGVGAWMTMDAGANVHVICEPRDEPDVVSALASTPGVADLVRDRVGPGPRVLEESLFDSGAPDA